jgi:predicted TIM-barrel fold metal-dependent hydrolase
MKKGIIDFHTHAFPDGLAGRAIKGLEEASGEKAHLNGTIESLLSSMDRYGIEKSVVCSIATRPGQFDSILRWSEEVRSDRIIPFPSVHPEDPLVGQRITEIRKAGFKGIKLHPYYQDFELDEERIFPLYEKAIEENLIIVMHTGFDIAFPDVRKAGPRKVVNVMERFPRLKMVTTHLGSWKQWEEVASLIIGKKIYIEISFSIDFLKEDARKFILSHPEEYMLFGTDSPWTGQGNTLSLLRGLNLGEQTERLILRENALRLLGSSG